MPMLTPAWLEAWNYTKANGVAVPPLPPPAWAGRKYATEAVARGVLGRLKAEYQGASSDRFTFKCFDIHNFIYNTLYDVCETPCYLTLGWAEYRGEAFFKHSRTDLENWLKAGVPDLDHVDMHCWITFPSGEMLDATLPSAIALREGRTDEIGILHWFEDEASSPYQYHPTMIGMGAMKALRLAF